MRFIISKMFLKFLVAISFLVATNASSANYCDMASCGTSVRTDSGIAIICNRISSECDCATLPSDCYAARRVSHTCSGTDGWVRNYGKMIGNKDGTICCGYKLAANAVCPQVPKDDQPISGEKDYKKGFFTNEFYGWYNADLSSVRGSRPDYEKAYLDICLGAHHTDEINSGTLMDKWESCHSLCKNPKINKSCKSKTKNSRFTICENNCNCLYQNNECLRN
jgi:hypothetical protein